MKISLFIPAIVLYYAVRVVCSNCVQVGTVLFTTTDLVKKCWSENDKALLRARLIMQDVLPDPDCIDFSKPDMVLTLLDYFQSCYDIISLSTYGNIQNLMYLAMSDALGGYLRGYALPLTRMAFYSGQIKYSEAKKLFRLYDDIRAFLNTNGVGWTKPQKLCKNRFVAKPLAIGDSKGVDPCNQLYTIVKRSGSRNCRRYDFNDENQEENGNMEGNPRQLKSELRQKSLEMFNKLGKSGKKEEKFQNITEIKGPETFVLVKVGENKSISNEVDLSRRRNNEEEEKGNVTIRYGRSVPSEEAKLENDKCKFEVAECDCFSGETFNKIVVPLPVLDDCKTLHTIAVPFKVRPLRNVQTRKSAFILEHYYVAVIKCLMSKCSSQNDIKHFNALFHTWLVTQVLPHLDDEQWYPAFGGVYRITETIRKLGTDFSIRESAANDIGYIFSKGFEFEDDNCDRHSGKEKTREVGDELEEDNEMDEYRPRKYFLGAIIVLVMIWTCVCCACVTSCCAHDCGRTERGGVGAAAGPGRTVRCLDDDRFLNFHFLIRFFKKQSNGNNGKSLLGSMESFCKSNNNNNNNKIVNYFTSEKGVKIEKDEGSGDNIKRKKREENFSSLKLQLGTIAKEALGAGECNIPVLITADEPSKDSEVFSKVTWPRDRPTSLTEVGKVEPTEKSSHNLNVLEPVSADANLKDKNKKKTLWNKLSRKIAGKGRKIKNSDSHEEPNNARTGSSSFKRGDGNKKKDIVLRKFGEFHADYNASSIPSANSFSLILGEDDSSFEKNKVFKRVKRKHKPIEQSSLEETTDESGSEREASYTTETESSETMHT